MSDMVNKREIKSIENDEHFLEHLQEVSEKVGLEPGQILKACFAIGWDHLNQRITIEQKENINDEK